jgi:hypothetical protein
MLGLFKVPGANAASSDRRSAPAKPTSTRARPRTPLRSSAIGARSSRSTVRGAARFFCGLGASRRMPAIVSNTSAASVGEGSPAARCRKRIAAVRSFGVLPALP